MMYYYYVLNKCLLHLQILMNRKFSGINKTNIIYYTNNYKCFKICFMLMINWLYYRLFSVIYNP